MFCTKCGNQCDDSQRFCNNCGAPLEAPDAYQEEAAAEADVIKEPVINEPAAEDRDAEARSVEEASSGTAAPAAEEPTVQAPPANRPPVDRPAYQPPVPQAPYQQPPVRQTPYQQLYMQRPVQAPVYPNPAQQPYAPPAYAAPQKNDGAGKWIGRIIISCLPLLVTYFLMFLSRTGLFRNVSFSGARTLSLIFFLLIAASICVQIVFLLVWAIGGRSNRARRSWAAGFLIVAGAAIVCICIFAMVISLIHEYNYLDTLDNFLPSFGFLRALIQML